MIRKFFFLMAITGSTIYAQNTTSFNDNNIIGSSVGANNYFVDKAQAYNWQETSNSSNIYGMKEKGYFNITSIGFLIGSTTNEKVAPISCLIEHNFKLFNYLAIGGVIGFEMLNETVCPIAVSLKGCLPVKSGNLFLGISGGYSLSTDKTDDYTVKKGTGGTLFNAEIGYIAALSKNSGVYFAIGYRYNELNYKMQDWYWDNASRKMYFNRIVFRTGISLF